MADAERLTAWLVEHVAERERHHDRVHDELLARCRAERIEPPAPGRIDRIVRSALRVSEETLTARAVARLGQDTMLAEIDKLLAVRAVGVSAAVFADVAASVVSGWRGRAAVESPSHLRTLPEPLRLTLVAALLPAPA